MENNKCNLNCVFYENALCIECKEEFDRIYKEYCKRTEKQIEAIRQSEILSAEDYNIRVY